MVLSKKILMSMLVCSVIGATTVCMDGNAYRYKITVSMQSNRSIRNLGLGHLKTILKAAGAQEQEIDCNYTDQTVSASLPDQIHVGEGFIQQVLSKFGYSYKIQDVQAPRKNQAQQQEQIDAYELARQKRDREEGERFMNACCFHDPCYDSD
jgi:hypothetical protein